MTDRAPVAVFISYASKDAVAALRIAVALRAAGVEVWFDQNELGGGDAWDRKIRAQIGACALFVPVISAETQARHEGYFRLEWHLAEQRSLLIAKGRPFIVPVTIDATTERGALVPEAFLAVQWTRLPGGETGEAFCARVKKLLGMGAEMEAARPRPAQRDEGVAPPAKVGRRVPAAAWMGAAAAIAIGAGAIFFATRKTEPAASVVANAGAGTRPPTPESSAALASDKSIAVLPFANLSPDKENEFFADGVHLDLLTNLLGVRELRVISAQSVSGYRGTTKKISEIARELGVAYILTGSVRRAADTVRVSAQLIDARSDAPIWSPQPYTRKLTDIFAIQTELAQSIAAELKATLTPEEKKLLARRPTENLAAYDLYLKSRDPAKRAGPIGPWLSQREEMLQEAVRLDPRFTLAWVALANVHLLNYSWNFEHTTARLNKAKDALATAERLEPESIEVLSETGFFYANGLSEFSRAKACYERVLKLVPNHAHVWARQGYVARAEGRWGDSIANLRKAHDLDRRDADYIRELGVSLLAVRRFEETRVASRELIDLLPESPTEAFRFRELSFLATGSTSEVDDWFTSLAPTSRTDRLIETLAQEWAIRRGNAEAVLRTDANELGRAMLLAHRGDRQQAKAVLVSWRAVLETQSAAEQDNNDVWMSLGLVLAISGERDRALSAANRASQLRPESRHAWWGASMASERAKVLLWAGEKDEALREIERLLRKPSGMNIHDLKNSIAWLPLRGDPRFEALLNDPKNNAPLF